MASTAANQCPGILQPNSVKIGYKELTNSKLITLTRLNRIIWFSSCLVAILSPPLDEWEKILGDGKNRKKCYIDNPLQ